MHLSELVRLAFIAATATSVQLKVEGLETLQVKCICLLLLSYVQFYTFLFVFECLFLRLQEIVKKFSSVQDPDYAGHVILEQFQAQVTHIIDV